MFTDKLIRKMSSWANYSIHTLNIFTACINSEIGYEVLEASGVLSFLVL